MNSASGKAFACKASGKRAVILWPIGLVLSWACNKPVIKVSQDVAGGGRCSEQLIAVLCQHLPIKMIPSTDVPWNNRDGVMVIDHCYRISFPHLKGKSYVLLHCVYTLLIYLYSNRKML